MFGILQEDGTILTKDGKITHNGMQINTVKDMKAEILNIAKTLKMTT